MNTGRSKLLLNQIIIPWGFLMFRSSLHLFGAVAPTHSPTYPRKHFPIASLNAVERRATGLSRKPARTALRKIGGKSFLGACLLGTSFFGSANGGLVELVMPPVSVSAKGDISAFSTPLDVQDGHVVVAHVTDPDTNTVPGYVNTVIRKGNKSSGTWKWEQQTISNITLLDPYHTQPSVAFDKKGFVHMAYNMHNIPWQYVISAVPYSIHNFVFYGQAVSKAELDALRLQNKTYYPTQGKTLIPGNQITYPAFFRDGDGELYLSYRYASRPARAWDDRARAAGVARFDTNTWTWEPVGGIQTLNPGDFVHAGDSSALTSIAFAYSSSHTPYLVTLAFGTDKAMHAVWTWMDNASTTGENNLFPSYAKISDPTLPQSLASVMTGRIPTWSSSSTFNPAKSIAVAKNGDVLAIFEPQGTARKLVRRNSATGTWSAPVDTPWAASQILVDRNGNEWVFASGLNLFKRAPGGAWSNPIPVGTGLCYPRPVYVEPEHSFYIHAKVCSGMNKAVVYRYQID